MEAVIVPVAISIATFIMLGAIKWAVAVAKRSLDDYKAELLAAREAGEIRLMEKLTAMESRAVVSESRFEVLTEKVNALQLAQARTDGKTDAILAIGGTDKYAETVFGTKKDVS